MVIDLIRNMHVYVLLYEVGKDNEGIHSLELEGGTVVLMFENKDDADRYCGLLEAQDFPSPTVESIDREEIELFCTQAGYESRFVQTGFIPSSQEERFSLVPPEDNRDTSQWKDSKIESNQDCSENIDLDDLRNRLEGLM